MGKKSKSKSKDKKKKKKDKKKKEPEPIEKHIDFHEFVFPNGDSYAGYYCAERTGNIWREGDGTYITNDGHIYEGKWKNDKLDEDEKVHITYNNGDEFYGNLKNNRYTGPGTYKVKNGLYLVCEFANNKPSGDVLLLDEIGKCWYGRADKDAAFTFGEHVFYTCLDNRELTLGEKLISSVNLLISEDPGSRQSFTLEELEKIFFGKSSKTELSLDFENSDWYQDYLNNKDSMDDETIDDQKIKSASKSSSES